MKTPEHNAQLTFRSPIGPITIRSNDDWLVFLSINEDLGPDFGKSETLKKAKILLQSFFKGKPVDPPFDFGIDIEGGTQFQLKVWNEILQVPFGQTITYAEIARRIGNPKAVRAVGGAVGANPIPLLIGCHRVLGENGKITGYSGGDGIPTKRWLLNLEGIETKD